VKPHRWSLAVAAILALIATPALAYLVPAPGILKAYAKHREDMRIQRLMVRGQTTLYGDDAKAAIAAFKSIDASGETVLNVSLAYKTADEHNGGRCAIEIQAASGIPAEAGTTSNINGRIKVVGPDLVSQKVQAALVCPLLCQKSNVRGEAAPLLLTFLENVGVDTATESLGRVGVGTGTESIGRNEKEAVYIIGAKPRDLSKPQFWLGKDSFRPLRIIGKFEDKLYDVRLSDFTLSNTYEWHPREIAVYQGDTLLSRFIGDKGEPNVKIPDAIF
jgi:hypothetical protein